LIHKGYLIFLAVRLQDLGYRFSDVTSERNTYISQDQKFDLWGWTSYTQKEC